MTSKTSTKVTKILVEVYDVCSKFANACHVAYSDFVLQEGLFLKDTYFAYHSALIDDIIKDKHQDSLSGCFGLDKTLE